MNENTTVETSTIVESEEIDTEIEEELKPNLPPYTNASSVVKSTTSGLMDMNLMKPSTSFTMRDCNEEKYLFKLPSGNAAKMFIRELTLWLGQFNRGSEYRSIALKLYMIVPSFLLQKLTRNSKAKDHTKKLEERLLT